MLRIIYAGDCRCIPCNARNVSLLISSMWIVKVIKMYQKYDLPMLAVAKLYKTRPHCSLESPTVVAFPFVQMPWAVAFQDLPCPSHPIPSNGITAADVFFWVAGSLGRSLKVDVMFHDNRLHLRSAGEWDRLKSCHIPHIYLSYEVIPWKFKHQIKQRCFAKKNIPTVQNSPWISNFLKKCQVVFSCQYHPSPWHQSAILQKFRDQIETILCNGIIDGHMPLLIRAVWIGFSWRWWW